jgi:hypothetical protein
MRYDKETFLNVCSEHIWSIQVAISRKYNGSTVENGYFNEHIDKLRRFFNDAELD